MSRLSNHIVSVWQDVEAQLRRTPVLKYGTITLDQRNNSLIKDTILLWYLAGVDLLCSGDSTKFETKRWINNLMQCDVKELFIVLKEADIALTKGDIQSYDGFKHHLRTFSSHAGAILAPAKSELTRWFVNREPSTFSNLHCFFSFPSRVNITLESLEIEALTDYLNLESQLDETPPTTAEGELLTSWYPRTDIVARNRFRENIKCKHGSGSTSDAGKILVDKYLLLSSTLRLRALASMQGLSLLTYTDEEVAPCKLVFVPKSALGYRSISMEPATHMWYQQGILAAWCNDLYHYQPYLKKRFDPRDQSKNRELAWEGSINGEFSTIDLSSASDMVRWSLVKQWFHSTYLYPYLLCTRSSKVVYGDGKVIAMKKFAPMGSCLCFPIETLIFTAIVECAIKEAGGNPCNSRYVVYGDDIVVESEYSHHVIHRLERNGFRVNHRKTFTPDNRIHFRESCGGDYLDGCDVTPVRLSRRFAGLAPDKHHPSHIEALIQLSNDCFSRLPSVRRRCLHSLSRYKVVFDSSGERGVFSTQPTNFHLTEGYDTDTQQPYVLGGFSTNMDKGQYDDFEDIRLLEYLRTVQGRQQLMYPEDKSTVSVSPSNHRKWTLHPIPTDLLKG